MVTGMKTCPSCGADNPPGRQYCIICGANLAQPAPMLRSRIERDQPTCVRVPYGHAFQVNMRFPECCLYCCEPATTYKAVHVEREITSRRRKYFITLNFTVPYCGRHSYLNDMMPSLLRQRGRANRPYMIVGGIAGGIAGVILGTFLPGTDLGGFVLLGLLGGILGIIAGAVVSSFVPKPIAGVSDKEIRDYHNYHTTLGLRVWPEIEAVLLTFASSSYASKYAQENRGVDIVP